jgi:hypothetical protein
MGAEMSHALVPQRDREGTLVHVIETLLDKGLVLNADIMVSVAGVELLGIRIRAALASFETAARYGLEFPAGTDTETLAWRRSRELSSRTAPERVLPLVRLEERSVHGVGKGAWHRRHRRRRRPAHERRACGGRWYCARCLTHFRCRRWSPRATRRRRCPI